MFIITHPLTQVQFVEHGIEAAIARLGAVAGQTFREALLEWERGVALS